MRLIVFFVFCIFLTQPTYSQSINEAETVFNNKQYVKAKGMYESLLKRKPTDALLNYKYARCCFELKEFDLAVKHFELSGTKYALKDAYLAEAYFQNYQFNKSIETGQQYLATLDSTDNKFTVYQQLIKKAELGSRLLNRVEDITITDSICVNKTDFLKSYSFNAELGTLSQQRLKVGKQIQDKITFKTQRADRNCFSDSVKGNMDIFSSYKLLDDWTAPSSISKIVNTNANENYPFILPDGITLYFASDGENSLGGYDIFLTKYSAGSKDFVMPENIGFPFNSTANDYMLVLDEHQNSGWFATDRNQSSGKVVVYAFNYSEPKRYFKSDDTTKVIYAAKLKSVKRAKTKTTNFTKTTEKNEITAKPNSYIIINDSVIYKNPDQFKSNEAKQLYSDVENQKQELKKFESDLFTARVDYEKVDIDEKKRLRYEILQLENKILVLKNIIECYEKKAINLEIKFISQ